MVAPPLNANNVVTCKNYTLSGRFNPMCTNKHCTNYQAAFILTIQLYEVFQVKWQENEHKSEDNISHKLYYDLILQQKAQFTQITKRFLLSTLIAKISLYCTPLCVWGKIYMFFVIWANWSSDTVAKKWFRSLDVTYSILDYLKWQKLTFLSIHENMF